MHITHLICIDSLGCLSKSIMNRIVKLHKKGLRHVCSSRYNAHTEPLFKSNRILRIDDLFKLQCAKIMYKKKLEKIPDYHSEQLLTNFERKQLNTRQRHDIDIRKCNNCLTQINSINYKVGKSWNELPLEIKESPPKSLPSFTKHVKELYISNYSDQCYISKCYICERR